VPEIQDVFVPTLIKHIHGGNTALRQASCKCLVRILVHQHDFERRTALAEKINTEFAQSNAFQMRKTFVYFCKLGAGDFTMQFFIENFYKAYLALSGDKVSQVRMEFAKSLFEIKPFVENEQEIKFELMEKIEVLKTDEDCDVAEATDDMDFQLLH